MTSRSPEGVQEGAEAPQVQPVGTHPHQMAGDPPQLGDDQPDDHRLLRDLDVEQFLERQRHTEIHIHPGEIVHAVRVGHPLRAGQILPDLLGGSVQIPDVGGDFVNDFAVGPQQQAEHAMSAGMLRPHVDQHLVGADVEFDNALVFECSRHQVSLSIIQSSRTRITVYLCFSVPVL